MSSLKIEKEQLQGVDVVHVSGKLTLGESALRETVRSLTAKPAPRLVIDLAGVSYIDSAGIGELVAAYTTVTSQGGRLVLVGLQKRVAEVLQIVKLDTVFQILESTEQGVKALAETP